MCFCNCPYGNFPACRKVRGDRLCYLEGEDYESVGEAYACQQEEDDDHLGDHAECFRPKAEAPSGGSCVFQVTGGVQVGASHAR